MSYTVYMHITPSGKRYIGITCRKPEYRWNNGNGYEANKHFYSAINKYGWDNIKHVIVLSGVSKERACEVEKNLISKFDTTNSEKGYNHSTGGECGSAGVAFTEERRRKIGEAHKGMKHTAEARKKMSEAHTGLQTWNKGRHWTPAEKEVMAAAQRTHKEIMCVETGATYLSTRDAERKTGINRSSICGCLRKRKNCKTAGGYHWEYAQH